MRRPALFLAAVLALFGAVLPDAQAQSGAPAQPPHAYLFGTWTGGLFPVPASLSPQACLSQPVVIFTRDLVIRATLTEQTLIQREIETARASANGTNFRFAATGAPAGLLGGGSAAAAGFGCEDPNTLHVQRRGENEIEFPGCADFSYPLVRCHTR